MATIMTLCQPNLVEIIKSRPDLKALYKALKTTGLLATLANSQNITVFAPTNAAFVRLLAQQSKHCPLTKSQLRTVLLNHVFTPAQNSTSLIGLSGTTISSLNNTTYLLALVGTTLSLQWVVRPETYFVVAASSVIVANLTASNGIIHVVNEVLTS